jgi:hypothetical protein
MLSWHLIVFRLWIHRDTRPWKPLMKCNWKVIQHIVGTYLFETLIFHCEQIVLASLSIFPMSTSEKCFTWSLSTGMSVMAEYNMFDGDV